jgi:glycosyltransferase involved in cell wall biosynthesis
MPPLVSICIPAYNQPDKLIYLLDSIRCQTYINYEVIVSDDSHDESVKKVCEQYSDLKIRYIRNIPAKGTPQNWTHSISMASGAWIKIMHHDDYFAENQSLEKFVNFSALHPELDFIYSKTSIVYHPSKKRGEYKVDFSVLNAISDQSAYLFHKNLIGSPSVTFFRKSDFIDFDSDLKWLVDIEWYHRVIAKKTIGRINEPLIETIASEAQLSEFMRGNPQYEITEFLYCFRKHFESMNALSRSIMNARLIELLHSYSINNKESLLKYSETLPKIAIGYFLVCRLNRRLSYSLFYRATKFKLNRLANQSSVPLNQQF